MRFDPIDEEGFDPSDEEGFDPSDEEGFDPSDEEGFDPSDEEGLARRGGPACPPAHICVPRPLRPQNMGRIYAWDGPEEGFRPLRVKSD